MNVKSCVGCKYLYSVERGYTNWTWVETDVNCAKDRNPNLPGIEPSGWKEYPDNWQKTKSSRCDLYATAKMVAMDIEGRDGPAHHTKDSEAIGAICYHSGRPPYGTPGEKDDMEA